MIISISGPICSGKTTLSKMLANKLKCSEISAGTVYRQFAKDAGMSIEYFMKQESSNKKLAHDVDTLVINQALAIAKKDHDVVINGRLNNHLLTLYMIPGVRISLETDINTMVRRFEQREECDADTAKKKVLDRLQEDAKLFSLYSLEPWAREMVTPYGSIPVCDIFSDTSITYDGVDMLLSYIEHRRKDISYEKVSYL